MKFSKEQRKEAYQKLPEEIQDLIMSNETDELISNYLKQTGLDEDQSNEADSEIMYAMYGLQSLDDALGHITKLSGRSLDDLSNLKAQLQESIFSKYTEVKVAQQPSNTIHNDLPVIEEGEKVHTVPHDTTLDTMPTPVKIKTNPAQPVPATPVSAPIVAPTTPEASLPKAPTNEKTRPHSDTPIKKNELKTPDYRYPGGTDPYREPLA